MYTRISLNVLRSVQGRAPFVCVGQFSTSSCQYGRKSRDPFDKRFPVKGRHLSARVKGGSQELALRLSVHSEAQPGTLYMVHLLNQMALGHLGSVTFAHPWSLEEAVATDVAFHLPLKEFIGVTAAAESDFGGVGDAQMPGYKDKRSLKFRVVPEMVPEFIVPDLTNFELKPYVSYRVPEVTQSKLTARNLFDACYAEKLAESHRSGKLTKEEVDRILQLKPSK